MYYFLDRNFSLKKKDSLVNDIVKCIKASFNIHVHKLYSTIYNNNEL